MGLNVSTSQAAGSLESIQFQINHQLKLVAKTPKVLESIDMPKLLNLLNQNANNQSELSKIKSELDTLLDMNKREGTVCIC